MVAETTRGYSQYVLPNENLELSMSNFWGKVQDPVLAGLKLDSGDFRLGSIYPNELPDLFKGDQLVVFGTYTKSGKGAVTITGTVGTKDGPAAQKFAQDVTFDDKTDSSKEWIAKLWATRRVGYLLDQVRMHGESKELKDEIVELARRWGVVTPYTAMLIIEDERRRGVPLAQRSMREMEFDRNAAGNSSFALDSLRQQQSNGGQAVANSINSNAYKGACNLSEARDAASQTEHRAYFDGTNGPALAKAADAPSAQPAGTVISGGSIAMGGAGNISGGFGGRAGRGGGGGGRGTAAPVTGVPAQTVNREALNLGTTVQNGWQTAGQDKDANLADGYRTITNYAQQSRVINNRNFFLNGNQWTDANVQNMQNAKPVKIAFGSKDYFDLLAKFPDAAQFLSLGNNITLELGGTVYDIVEDTPPQ
jgi:hypothetical protein